MLALLVVAVALGMDNFGAAVGIGLSGADARTRVRIGLVFGAFETAMPIVGLLIGEQAAGQLGHAARWIGAALLIAIGGYGLAASLRANRTGEPAGQHQAVPVGLTRLILTGLALSLDNLVVGFALGTYHTSVVTGVVVIGAVSVIMSLLGLELGARIAAHAGARAEQLAGVMLIGIGIAFAAGAIS